MSVVAFAIGVLAGILAFAITWLISDFFIPPSYNWKKSAYSVFLIKLGMAGGAAFIAFSLVGNMLLDYFR